MDGNKVWRGALPVKSTGNSSREPGLSSQHPHSSSWLSVTPVPRAHGMHICTQVKHPYMLKTNKQTNKFFKKEKKIESEPFPFLLKKFLVAF